MNNQWEWFGHAGHLIVAQWCRFHLCTLVGDYLVSTVGEYVPDEGTREITAQVRKTQLVGRGDERLADYMNKIGFQEIGYNRTYETMVFRAGERCKAEGCACGLPAIDGSEIYMDGYIDAGSAKVGHMTACGMAEKGEFPE